MISKPSSDFSPLNKIYLQMRDKAASFSFVEFKNFHNLIQEKKITNLNTLEERDLATLGLFHGMILGEKWIHDRQFLFHGEIKIEDLALFEMGSHPSTWKYLLEKNIATNGDKNIEIYNLHENELELKIQGKIDRFRKTHNYITDKESIEKGIEQQYSSYYTLYQQKKAAKIEPELEKWKNGEPYLLAKLFAGRIDESLKLIEKGARIKILSPNESYSFHSKFFTYISKGRHNLFDYEDEAPLQKEDILLMEKTWNAFIQSGGPSFIKQNAFSTLKILKSGAFLRSELKQWNKKERDSELILGALLSFYHKKEWHPTSKIEKDPINWAISQGFEFKSISNYEFCTVFNGYGKKKSLIKKVVDGLVQHNISLNYQNIKDPRCPNPLQSLISGGIRPCDITHLKKLHFDFFQPLKSYGQFNILSYSFYFNEKNKSTLEALFNEMEQQDPKKAIEFLHQKMNDGSTLMHLAAKNFDLESLIYLQQKGLDVHAKDDRGNTILHWTTKKYGKKSQEKLLPVLEWLLEQNFDLSTKNNKNLTAFAALTKKAPIESLEKALDSNSDLMDIKDKYGKTPKDYLYHRQDDILPHVEKKILDIHLPENYQDDNKPNKKIRL